MFRIVFFPAMNLIFVIAVYLSMVVFSGYEKGVALFSSSFFLFSASMSAMLLAAFSVSRYKILSEPEIPFRRVWGTDLVLARLLKNFVSIPVLCMTGALATVSLLGLCFIHNDFAVIYLGEAVFLFVSLVLYGKALAKYREKNPKQIRFFCISGGLFFFLGILSTIVSLVQLFRLLIFSPDIHERFLGVLCSRASLFALPIFFIFILKRKEMNS